MSDTFASYPYLTREEFAEAAHLLDRRYRQATLGPLRRRWRLNVHRAFDLTYTSPTDDGGQSTYVQIVRPLETVGADDDDDALAAALDRALSLRGTGVRAVEGGDASMADEDGDEAALQRPSVAEQAATPDIGYVTYEIHLHPTYRVPCLWFSLHGLPAGERPLDVDTVFRRLVPEQYKEGLRKVNGIVGGISVDYHPITFIPTFFVHPCFLAEGMEKFNCSKDDYLLVWMGLVGGCVGLWVPSAMALEIPR